MIFKTSRNLINRKQQREKIANLLIERGDESKFDVLEFFGVGGLGKSRILEAAKQECRESSLPFVAVDFLSFNKQSTQNPELDILLHFCDSLDRYTDFSQGRSSLTSLTRNDREENSQKLKGRVVDQSRLADFRIHLTEALKGKPLILMLDSIEHCPDELFNWLGREFFAPLVAEQGISSVIVFLAGRGPRVAESNWPPALKVRTESLRLDPLEFEHSLEHISNLPSEINYRGAAREIYALSNGHSYSTEAIIHWLNSLGVKVEDVGAQRIELARRLREEVIRKYILSDADEWVLPFLEIVCYFRWFSLGLIKEFIQRFRPELGKDLPVQWYSARLVDLQKRPLHMVYLGKVHYRLEPTLQKLLHTVTAILNPEEAGKIHSEAIECLERELQRNETRLQKGGSSDNVAALTVAEILYHKAHLGAITGNKIDIHAGLAELLKKYFDPKSPRDLESLEFLRNTLENDIDLNELLTSHTVKELVQEIEIFLAPATTPEQPFKLSHLIIEHAGPAEYRVSWYQANHVVIPVEKVISTQRFDLSEWRNDTKETGKTAFTAFLPERSQEFIRSRSGWAIQLTTNRVDIPWELLHDDHEFLCLSRPMGRRPQSLKEQKLLPERMEGPLRALIVGNPNGDLPGAEEEARLIASALLATGVEVELLLGEQATAKQFSKKIRNQMFDLIHFAGHAYFEQRAPDMSGLMFHDNPMPASELGRHLSSQALVFLSACEAGMSGVTENRTGMLGEFVAGIATSILFGGAIGCVAPMWGIEDGAAKDFSLFFYQHLLSGKVVGESLRQARLAVRESSRNEDAWKAWVLYGDPTISLDFTPSQKTTLYVSNQTPIAIDNRLQGWSDLSLNLLRSINDGSVFLFKESVVKVGTYFEDKIGLATNKEIVFKDLLIGDRTQKNNGGSKKNEVEFSACAMFIQRPDWKLNIPDPIPVIFPYQNIMHSYDLRSIRQFLAQCNTDGDFAIILVPQIAPDLRDVNQTGFVIIDFQEFEDKIAKILKPKDSLRDIITERCNLLNIAPFKSRGPISRPELYFGRKDEINNIVAHIGQQSYFLVGFRRSGKTSTLHILKNKIDMERGQQMEYLFMSLEAVENYSSLFENIGRDYPGLRISKDFTVNDFIGAITTYCKTHATHLILSWDETDRLLAFDAEHDWALFRSLRSIALTPQPPFSLLLAGFATLYRSLHNGNSPLYNFGPEIILRQHDLASVGEMIQGPMEALRINVDPEVIEKIDFVTSGEATLIQYICERATEVIDKQKKRLFSKEIADEIIQGSRFQREYLDVAFNNNLPLYSRLAVLLALDNPRGQAIYEKDIIAKMKDILPGVEIEKVQDAISLLTIHLFERQGHLLKWAMSMFPEIFAQNLDLALEIAKVLEDIKNAR